MHRRFLPLLLAIAAFIALPKAASAQFFYSTFGSSNFDAFPSAGGYIYTPRPPKARHDHRIDPHLLAAARIADRNAFPHSTARCWRYVKQALLQAGAVNAYPGTNYAFEAGQELISHYGFVRLSIHDPYNAPVGSVLVYRGGSAGHVEIRTEHGFASDYRSSWCCRYHLIGVYAKLGA
jgi:hypothetical protein